jgi:pyruvate/2-oxoglutarate dehydrogenase complex dihydrolipoamide acyltransferase (E2) component
MEFVVPALDAFADWSGGAPEEAEVAKLVAADGARVAEGDEVIELSLDKANVALQAPTGGVIRWRVEVGDLVTAGSTLASIE